MQNKVKLKYKDILLKGKIFVYHIPDEGRMQSTHKAYQQHSITPSNKNREKWNRYSLQKDIKMVSRHTKNAQHHLLRNAYQKKIFHVTENGIYYRVWI